MSVNTVAEIMSEQGWYGRESRKRRSFTWPGRRKAARDLVGRHFDAVAPDVLWVGDMTEIDTGVGRLWPGGDAGSVLRALPWLCDGRAARHGPGQRVSADGGRDTRRCGRSKPWPPLAPGAPSDGPARTAPAPLPATRYPLPATRYPLPATRYPQTSHRLPPLRGKR